MRAGLDKAPLGRIAVLVAAAVTPMPTMPAAVATGMSAVAARDPGIVAGGHLPPRPTARDGLAMPPFTEKPQQEQRRSAEDD